MKLKSKIVSLVVCLSFCLVALFNAVYFRDDNIKIHETIMNKNEIDYMSLLDDFDESKMIENENSVKVTAVVTVAIVVAAPAAAGALGTAAAVGAAVGETLEAGAILEETLSQTLILTESAIQSLYDEIKKSNNDNKYILIGAVSSKNPMSTNYGLIDYSDAVKWLKNGGSIWTHLSLDASNALIGARYIPSNSKGVPYEAEYHKIANGDFGFYHYHGFKNGVKIAGVHAFFNV